MSKPDGFDLLASFPSERQVSLPSKVVVSLKAGALLAIANVVCVLIFSWAWMHVRAEPKVITVTGSAKKAIESDLIIWSGRISATDTNLTVGYDKLKTSTDKAMAYLRGKGIAEKQITVSSINTTQHREKDAKGNPTEKIAAYELSQAIEITSHDINRVSAVSREITGLIKEGVLLESDSPRYIYTKLADMKITMLAEATKDATLRAQQIAHNSGATLGSIVEAKMGVMQITAIHDNDVSGSGVNDTSSFEKEITAVVNVRFSLK